MVIITLSVDFKENKCLKVQLLPPKSNLIWQTETRIIISKYYFIRFPLTSLANGN